ncbi:MAG: hypothetical protein OIF57_10255 [Marinobacterium sp.]|nr:hypothetical protein [Marinobacterium sp.]
MERYLSLADKFDIQQNYRRYVRLAERHDGAMASYNDARASRVWVVGIIALLFALSSKFFMGAAAGMFGVYFYSVVRSWMRTSEVNENMEQLDRWFSTKGLRFEGRIMYSQKDELLEQPLDPFDDACYR